MAVSTASRRAPKTGPLAPEQLLGIPCIPVLLEESCDPAAGLCLQFPQLSRSSIGAQTSPSCLSPCLPGSAAFAPHLEGHSGIAPKGHGPCHFRRLKITLSPKPGFVHESRENPHLLKSLFPIQRRWTAQWKKTAVFVLPDPNHHLCLRARLL